MVTKSAGFAKYSKTLCWLVAAIWLVLSILAFTGGADNAMVTGILWLAGAIAFAISAMFIGRHPQADTSGSSEQPGD